MENTENYDRQKRRLRRGLELASIKWEDKGYITKIDEVSLADEQRSLERFKLAGYQWQSRVQYYSTVWILYTKRRLDTAQAPIFVGAST